MKNLKITTFLAALALAAASPAYAVSGSWTADASGNWSSAGNWAPGIPDGAGQTADINNNITAARVVTIDGTSRTVGILNLGDSTSPSFNFSLTSSGGAALILDNSGSAAVVTASGGLANTITAPIRLTDGGAIVNNIAGSTSSFGLTGGVSSIASSGTQILSISSNGSSIFSLTSVSDGIFGGVVGVTVNGGTFGFANNTFSGDLVISRGSVRTGSSGLSDGLSAITLGDAFTAGSAATLAPASGTYANNITVNAATASIIPNVAAVDVILSGSVTLNQTLSVTPSNSGTIAFTGNISGTSGLSFPTNNGGANVITFSGSNTFSGGMRATTAGLLINLGSAYALGSGTLTLGSSSATQLLTLQIDNSSGAALTLATNNDISLSNVAFVGSNDLNLGAGAVSIAPAYTITTVMNKKLTIGGVISGAGKSFGNAGSGTMALTAANTYTGTTYVGGVLSVTSLANGGVASNIGQSTNSETNLLLNRGTLQYTGTGASTDRLFTIGNGGATIESSGSGALIFVNSGSILSADSGTIALLGGTTVRGFVSGGTTINNINTSGLAVGQTVTGANLAPGTTITEILDGGRITISTPSTGLSTSSAYTFGALDRTLTLSGSNTGNNSIAGILTDSATKTLGVTKSGSGKWILSGSNSYTGATTVSAGTLVVATSGRLSNSSAVTVSGGGNFAYNSAAARTGSITLNGSGSSSRAILSGTGAISTAVVLDNVGDTLSPGNSPGTMTFGVSQTFNSFTYQWETNNFVGTAAGTDFDQIAIVGGLNLTGGTGAYFLDLNSLTALNVAGNVGNFTEANESWIILTTSAGITGFSAANWTILTSNFTSSPTWAGTWSLSQVGNDLRLDYAAVPEPGPMALLLGGGMVLLLYRRRALRR
ncbi:hypothetical protein BH09VER1_BH09VER1_08090 [soil metagenome]